MFLLILSPLSENDRATDHFTFQYVSINTLTTRVMPVHSIPFTFQYVSINTSETRVETAKMLPLHSNMFLLIRDYYSRRVQVIRLYIPICFY